ncbi:DUF3800 domain-containing protein [Roseicyclus elongatus]|uniref:DUF3800 domain-containing protein n=1 Tax=Roseicyclus elongatus TaxID=159346 RepID=UPI0009FF6212|nr:DUF3800 domain-containing protein [Roseibacterium elongatum]
MPFSVYIDESGDAGIVRVRDEEQPGSSPYFVLAACVVQPASAIQVRKAVEAFRSAIGKKNWKHATDLNHSQKVFFCRSVSTLPVRFFGLVSKKSTLKDYKSQIGSDPQHYYNKCLQYLLERVFTYLSPRISSSEEVSVILENRNHDYDRMIRFLAKVKDNPFFPESKALQHLNPFGISTRLKGEEDILEVSDLVSHALFQCVNKSKANYYIPEYRYFQELSSRFAADDAGRVLGAGLKCIHSLDALELDSNVKEVFQRAKAPPPI